MWVFVLLSNNKGSCHFKQLLAVTFAWFMRPKCEAFILFSSFFKDLISCINQTYDTYAVKVQLVVSLVSADLIIEHLVCALSLVSSIQSIMASSVGCIIITSCRDVIEDRWGLIWFLLSLHHFTFIQLNLFSFWSIYQQCHSYVFFSHQNFLPDYFEFRYLFLILTFSWIIFLSRNKNVFKAAA